MIRDDVRAFFSSMFDGIEPRRELDQMRWQRDQWLEAVALARAERDRAKELLESTEKQVASLIRERDEARRNQAAVIEGGFETVDENTLLHVEIDKLTRERDQEKWRADRMSEAVQLAQHVFSEVFKRDSLRCLHGLAGHRHDDWRELRRWIEEIDNRFGASASLVEERDEAEAWAATHQRIREQVAAECDSLRSQLETLTKERDEAGWVIRELRQKLSIAGVEGSPPPGEQGTIPMLLQQLHEARRERDEARGALLGAVQQEREACAKVAEEKANRAFLPDEPWKDIRFACLSLAKAIRSRSAPTEQAKPVCGECGGTKEVSVLLPYRHLEPCPKCSGGGA